MKGVVVEADVTRATRVGELAALLMNLRLLGQVVGTWAAAWLVWNVAGIAARAHETYRICGFVYYEISDKLPRCMRELIESRWWLDLVQ